MACGSTRCSGSGPEVANVKDGPNPGDTEEVVEGTQMANQSKKTQQETTREDDLAIQ